MSDDSRIAEMQAHLRSMEGSLGPPDSMPIEFVSVRRMALSIEAFDPIHHDEAVARARGYRGVEIGRAHV